eukprot:CAMPEP_0181430040 /NCGR_PEP_ID=MMETSP1110-20121109/17515_1 /TAXON_ID=174948 /ORGANISM="Symbiodinium sp., Strain CCMP421" /LENGTH=685 /DNA_ID=CAMNT_0023553337 /DNA_START=169 /DNA_END=2226 /DNA_ORIENTATION=-
MYQRVPTNEFFDAAPEPRCCSTRGVTFNFLVGVVVCANALLLGIEADLGLLGPAGPKWTGFETDVLSMHAVGNELEKGIESEIKSGIKADRIIKDDLRYKVNETIHKDIAFNSELALPSGGQLKYAAYTVCEYFFVLFYLLEMFLRMCDLGCRNYCCKYAWMPLDLAVVTTGLLDLSLPFFLEDDLERMSVLPFLRLLRVLRLLKLFQICQPLRIIGRGVVKAFAVVVLVGMVVLVLNFGLSVILTTLVGQRSMLWADETTEDIATWFGSIGRSMQTLFTIQTLAGWDNIANVLGTVYPSTVVVPLIVLYMMVCVFAVVGLITSVISDSFMASQQRELKSRELSKDLKRESVASELGKLFAQHGRTVPGFINRKELEAALQEPFVTQVLSSMEVPAMKTDILKLFDRMNQETSFAGRIQAEHMAEAVASMGGGWRVYGFFDVKHQVIGVKNEVQIKAELAAKDASEQRRELHELDKKSRQLVQEVQRDVASVREELSVVKGQISKVLVKMEEQSAWLEQEKRDRISTTADMQEKINVLTTQTAAFSGISGKVDVIAAQVASQSTLQGKMDALSVQVATQAMVGAKVEALLGQVSAQMVALHTDKKVDDRLLEDRDVKPAEPAAEPESSFVTEAAASAEERSRSPKNADWLEAAHPGEATPSPSGGKTEDWATFPPMSGDDKPEQD